MGARRQLKKAHEDYWQHRIGRQELFCRGEGNGIV